MGSIARIATVCQAGFASPSAQENRAYMMDVLDLALRQKPDLVCLPEAFSSAGVSCEHIAQVAESLPGPTTDAAAQRARQGGCYVICPLVTRRDGQCWNSAVVIDRSGAILGVYDKLHPVTSSSDYTTFEQGTQPGSAAPVFQLDFGKVGIQICFDIQFPAGWASLAEQGARMVFWPSAYNGGFPLQAYAWQNHYYVVSAVHTNTSRIIDPCGAVLAETDTLMNLICREINLDYAVCHYDFNYNIPEWILQRFPGQAAVRTYADESHFILEILDDSLTIDRLKHELGFLSVKEYTGFHQAALERLRAGQPPISQHAAHHDRPMYTKQIT